MFLWVLIIFALRSNMSGLKVTQILHVNMFAYPGSLPELLTGLFVRLCKRGREGEGREGGGGADRQTDTETQREGEGRM